MLPAVAVMCRMLLRISEHESTQRCGQYVTADVQDLCVADRVVDRAVKSMSAAVVVRVTVVGTRLLEVRAIRKTCRWSPSAGALSTFCQVDHGHVVELELPRRVVDDLTVL